MLFNHEFRPMRGFHGSMEECSRDLLIAGLVMDEKEHDRLSKMLTEKNLRTYLENRAKREGKKFPKSYMAWLMGFQLLPAVIFAKKDRIRGAYFASQMEKILLGDYVGSCGYLPLNDIYAALAWGFLMIFYAKQDGDGPWYRDCKNKLLDIINTWSPRSRPDDIMLPLVLMLQAAAIVKDKKTYDQTMGKLIQAGTPKMLLKQGEGNSIVRATEAMDREHQACAKAMIRYAAALMGDIKIFNSLAIARQSTIDNDSLSRSLVDTYHMLSARQVYQQLTYNPVNRFRAKL